MSTVVKDLGAVSAYAYAVEKGYTGTEAEFAELMADYAEVGQRAEDAAKNALNSKTAAQTAATTATNKASEATTAKNDAVAAKTAAETAQGKAEDAQAAAESVAESIPSDYSQLSEDVSDLKEGLSAMSTATSSDVGKALKAKTVTDGKVTEWEFGEAGETGGLSGEAVTLLISILTAGVYTSDQSSNIEALLVALGGLPVTWEKVGKTLVFSNVEAITSITQSGTTLVCA